MTRVWRRHRKRDAPTQEQTETIVPTCTLQAGPPGAGSGAGEKMILHPETWREETTCERTKGRWNILLLLPLLLLLLLIIIIIIIITTPRSRVLLEKLIGPHLDKKFPWNRRVYDCVHKSPPLVRILSQISPVHGRHATSWRSILILSLHLRLRLQSCPLKASPPKPYTRLSSSWWRQKSNNSW